MSLARSVYKGPEKVKVRGSASSPDPDEATALAHAATAARIPESTATACISAWISKRAQLSAGARLTENLAFDLRDAKLRGIVAAALPKIGAALNVPPGVAFFDLPRDAVIDLFCIAYQAVQDAEVAADERPFESLKGMPIGDSEIPF